MADSGVTSFKDLFDFSDTTEINQAIKSIEQLSEIYQKMVTAIAQANNKLSAEFSKVKDNAAATLGQIDSLGNEAAKNSKAYDEAAKRVGELSNEYATLKAQQAEYQKTIAGLQDQIEKLSKSKQTLSGASKAESGSINDLKSKLAEAEKAYKNLGAGVDKSIKASHLKIVAGLNSELKASSVALNEAKKSAKFAEDSYNGLSAKVAAAKRELQAMKGGITGNSAEFKTLQKYVADNTEVLKKWDDKVGTNTRNVGNYKSALSGMKGGLSSLIPGFSGAAGAIDSMSTAGASFIATPIGAVIAALGLAVATVSAYFKGSVEGQDKWNKVMAYGSTIVDLFVDGLEMVGGAITSAFENPKEAVLSLWEFIKENIVNRIEGLGQIFKAIGKIISSGFTSGYKDLGNAVIKTVTGVDNLIEKIGQASQKLIDETARRLKIEQNLANKENAIRKEKIRDVVDDAQTELKINKLLEEAKDKIAFSDEQRLAKVRQARALLAEQTKGDIMLAQMEADAAKLQIEAAGGKLLANKKLSEYTDEEIKQIGVKYELIEALAAKEADLINVSSEASAKQKTFLKQEVALIQEITKEYFANAKAQKETQKELSDFVLQDQIKRNNEILNDEDSSLEDRLGAIRANVEAQKKLLDDGRTAELDALKQDALEKIQLDDKTIQKIYGDRSKSIQQQIQDEYKARENALQNDSKFANEKKLYIEQVELADKKYTQAVIDNLNAAKDAGTENVYKVLQRDLNILESQSKTNASNQLADLNKLFTEGEINLATYEERKKKIIADSTKASLNTQLQYYQKLMGMSDRTAEQQAADAARVSELTNEIAQADADKKIEIEKRKEQVKQEINQASAALLRTLIDSQFQEDLNNINRQLQAEQDAKDKSLELAGNDAAAKAVINQNFANKKAALEKKAAETRRKQATADKALSIAQAIINTALGVTKALGDGSLPLAILVGILGAIQVATIAATPLPAFAKGTEDAPEGFALVGERGREIVMDKDGDNARVYEGPTVTYLKKGSIVKDNFETESILAQQAKKYGDGLGYGYQYSRSAKKIVAEKQQYDSRLMVNAIERNGKMIVEALGKQETNVWDDTGYRRFLRDQNTRVELLNKKTSFK